MKSDLNKQKAQPLVLMLILTALCLIIALSSWLAGRGTFTLTLTQNLTDASLAWEAGEIPIEDIKTEENRTVIVFRPNVPGDYTLQFREGADSVLYDDCIRVMPHGTVYSMRTGHFTGDAGIIGAIALFFAGTALICLIRFFRLKGPAAYSGGAVTTFGAGIICAGTGVILIRLFVLWITNAAPDQFIGSLTSAASSGEDRGKAGEGPPGICLLCGHHGGAYGDARRRLYPEFPPEGQPDFVDRPDLSGNRRKEGDGREAHRDPGVHHPGLQLCTGAWRYGDYRLPDDRWIQQPLRPEQRL